MDIPVKVEIEFPKAIVNIGLLKLRGIENVINSTKHVSKLKDGTFSSHGSAKSKNFWRVVN